jgi:hypothetical protein
MIFLGEIKVRLFEPIVGSDEDGTIIGYWQIIGIRADSSDDAAAVLELRVTDGDVVTLQIGKAGPANLPAEMKNALASSGSEPVWYRSGRAFFSDESAFEDG